MNQLGNGTPGDGRDILRDLNRQTYKVVNDQSIAVGGVQTRGPISGVEAYGTSLTSARIVWTSQSPVRIFRKKSTQSAYSQIAAVRTPPYDDVLPEKGVVYDYLLVDDYGHEAKMRVPMPYPTAAKVWTPVYDSTGVLYAMVDDGSQSLRKSTDGGRTWTVVKSGGGIDRLFIFGDQIYATSSFTWSSYRSKLWKIDKAGTGSWTQQQDASGAPLVLRNPGGDSYPAYIYPWAFARSKDGVFAFGLTTQYNAPPWTSANASNSVYHSSDGLKFTEIPFVPNGSTYARHTHGVAYNHILDEWFVAVGETVGKCYRVSKNWGTWTEVLDMACTSIFVTPSGDYLVGTDTPNQCRIYRIGVRGDVSVALALPSGDDAVQSWGISGWSDGEIWASVVPATAGDTTTPINLYVSQDHGYTWRRVWRSTGAVLFPGHIARDYYSGLITGQHIVMDQYDSSSRNSNVWDRLGRAS